MNFNVSNFRANGLGAFGGARPSLFDVSFVAPAVNGLVSASNKFTLACRAAELPPAVVGTIEVPYFGRKLKFAGDRTFPDWTIVVMEDEDWVVRNMFEAWSNGINSLIGNLRDPGALSEAAVSGAIQSGTYKADVTVNQYSKTGSIVNTSAATNATTGTSSAIPIAQYLVSGAYPSSVGPITVDWENSNQIETYQVTFSYDWWQPLTGPYQASVGVDAPGN